MEIGAPDYPIIVLALTDYVGNERRFHVTTGTLTDISIMGSAFQQVMPSELIERLHLHGQCAGCSGPVDAALTACDCGHVPRHGGVLEVTIFDNAAHPRFDNLLAKMLDRAKSYLRRARQASVANTLTEAEVDLRLGWQRGMCFYCG